MKRTKKESAVSPVVGVMLMLVVTIIIAGVVALFAGGIGSDMEKAPTVVMKAEADSTWGNGYGTNGTVFITSVSGDPIELKKVSVILTNKTGITYKIPELNAAGGTGDELDSGETLNLAYGGGQGLIKDSGKGNGKLLFTTGDKVRVTVTYDGKHVLFDKEVKAL